ncbi:MAG: hypothetical protein PHR06_10255 [Candidatus Cloacimonetes bacterium]|nr:hypothetical protein [Candidatus Cloacimonadota bacterium]
MGKFPLIMIATLLLVFSAYSAQLRSNKTLSTESLIETHTLSEVRNMANSFLTIAVNKLAENSNTQPFNVNNALNTDFDVSVDFEKWTDSGSDLAFGEIKIFSSVDYVHRGKTQTFTVTAINALEYFTDFLIFTDRMGGSLPNGVNYTTNFMGDQVVNGKLHTNSDIYIGRNNSAWPNFYGDVSCGGQANFWHYYNGNQYNYAPYTNDPNSYQGFHGSFTDGMSLISPTNTFFDPTTAIFPPYDFTGNNQSLFGGFDPNNNKIIAYDNISNSVYGSDYAKNSFYDRNSTRYISFSGDKMYVSPVPQNCTPEYDNLKIEISLDDLTENYGGVFYTDGDVHIEGTVNGDVSIATDGDIYIDDDITYAGFDPDAEDPLENCDSYLGLMAKGNININSSAKYEWKKSSKWVYEYGNWVQKYVWDWFPISNQFHNNDGELSITAGIFSQHGIVAPGMFGSTGGQGSLNNRGALNLYGSYAAKDYGATGWNTGNGYHKNFYYDQRFLNHPVAGIPYVETAAGEMKRKLTMWDESNNF